MKTRNDKSQFSDKQIKMAAKWWAQFLPGRKKVTFETINKIACLEGETAQFSRMMYQLEMDNAPSISDAQYKDFIKILSDKIRHLNVKTYSSIPYLKMGDVSSYHPPQIVEEALKEAQISESGFGWFPYKTEMNIYNNGQISVNGEIFSTNPEVIHFDVNHTDFSIAPFMKITGHKFRIVEINMSELKKPLCGGFIEDTRIVEPEMGVKQLFTSFNLSDFKGSEEEFLKLSNDELVDILQDAQKLKVYFPNLTCILYNKSKEEMLKDTSFSHIGAVTKEELSTDYYQYSTGPVKVILAPQSGTVKAWGLEPVSENDFLIARENSNHINYLPKKGGTSFEARFCDKNGNIISDTVCKPGNALPPIPLYDIFRENLKTSAVSYIYKSIPERFHHLTPEKDRSTLQNVTAAISDAVIDTTSQQMLAGNIMLPSSVFISSYAAMAKTMALKDRNIKEDKTPEPIGMKDVKNIMNAAAQCTLNKIALTYAKSMAENRETPTTVASSTIPLAISLFAAPIVQQLRVPGDPQVPANEENIVQQLGHMAVNAGILGALTFLPTAPDIALAGCFIGVLANTFVGKKRGYHTPPKEKTYSPSM